MSRPTPDDEYAAGMLSCFSQAPVANWKKLEHARVVVSSIAASTTFSGGRLTVLAGACAWMAIGAETAAASSANASVRRETWNGWRIEGLRSGIRSVG